MVAFALAAALALTERLEPTLVFVLFLITRGLLFGAALAAIGPTVQTVIAARTTAGPERVSAIAGIGAAQGSAIVFGAAGGAALGAFGLVVPLVAIPALLVVGLSIVITSVPKRRADAIESRAARVTPSDRRVRDFLIAGFLLYSALGFIQLLVGFVIVDRFALDPSTATTLTGVALLAAGVGVIVAQAVVVPRLRWSPRRLIATGAALAAVAVGALAAPVPLWIIVILVGLSGFTIGIAAPGVTAGATLRATPDEQGSIAGLTGAVIAASFIVAPTLSTGLYAAEPVWPFLVAAGLLLATTTLALASGSIRDAGGHFGTPNGAASDALE